MPEVSDHHPMCECGPGKHYSGCQLQHLDAKTKEDWERIEWYHAEEARKAHDRYEYELDLMKQARKKKARAA